MIFKSKNTKIFIDIDSPFENYDGTLDIVLSPAFYWIKKINFKVNSERKLTPLLPSVFDENIPEGFYSYLSYQSDNGFYGIAYDDSWIIKELESKGISPNQIGNVFLAQFEFEGLETNLSINNKFMLSNKDGVIIRIPSIDKDIKSVEVSNKTKSRSINLKQYTKVNLRILPILSVLSLLMFVLGFEWMIEKNLTLELNQERNKVFEEYPLKKTFIQNKDILQKLKIVSNQQLSLRKAINHALKIKLQGKEEITNVNFENKILNISIENIEQKRIQNIVDTFKNNGFNQISINNLKKKVIIGVEI